VISGYGKERTMLVHSDDFHRLDELDRMLTGAADPLRPRAPIPEKCWRCVCAASRSSARADRRR